MPWPSDDPEILNKIDFAITLTGPGATQTLNAKAEDTIKANVSAGQWQVKIVAYLQDIETPLTPNGEQMPYATGISYVEVKAGQTSNVSIPMTAEFCRLCNFITTIPASCTEPGMVGITCTVPEHNDTKPVYPLGHHANSWNWSTYDETTGKVNCTRAGCTGGFASIGDTGPGGGLIFYVAPAGFTVQASPDGTWQAYTAYYLEAYPRDIDGTRAWTVAFEINDLIPGLSQNGADETDWVIGRGRMNTAIIIARGISEGYDTEAASACAALGVEFEWFLPSRNELNELYKLYAANGHGSYGNLTTEPQEWYWSSSQATRSQAHRQDFSNGTQNSSLSKPGPLNVRAIRAF